MTDPTPAQLHHLANRARDGVALPAEHDQLAAGITAMAERLEQAEAARELLRRFRNRWAAHAERLSDRALTAEAAIERVRQLHQPAPGGSGGLSFNSGDRCAACDHSYRCDTIRALDQAQQPTT